MKTLALWLENDGNTIPTVMAAMLASVIACSRHEPDCTLFVVVAWFAMFAVLGRTER